MTKAKKTTEKKVATKGATKTAEKNTAKVANKSNSKQQELKVPAFISVESTLGAISILCMKSSTHKHLFLSDYEWLILPAISTKQFVLFRVH